MSKRNINALNTFLSKVDKEERVPFIVPGFATILIPTTSQVYYEQLSKTNISPSALKELINGNHD